MSERLPKKIDILKRKFLSGPERTALMKKNIILTLSLRVFTVFPSILLVPLTIDYVNAEQYGIWLTLSSILMFMSLFDFGLSNGFRNKFAEARASNNDELAGQFVSTTYFVITIISLILFITFEIINIRFDWCSFLNVSHENYSELRECFAFLILFFCSTLITNILTSLLTADQKPSLASLIQAIGQVLLLIAIILFRILKETGSIVELAIVYSGIPFFIALIASFYFYYFTGYKTVRPRIKNFRIDLIKDIMYLGFKFFVITCCSMVIFQLMAVIITRELGATAVTQYNVANKYFNILYMPAIIILTPLWSAVTDAYVKKDFDWIRRLKRKIEKFWLYCIGLSFLMLLFSPLFYRIWVGELVEISFQLSAFMATFIVIQIIGTAYIYIINGIGKVTIQTIIYIVFALFSYPLFVYTARNIGLEGMMLIPISFYVVQTLLGRLQIHKILNDNSQAIQE